MHLAVTAVGLDRPGIVAAVSRALAEHGGNIEDSRMALLGGHFAVMLIVAVPQDADRSALSMALTDATASLELAIRVEPVAETRGAHVSGTPYLLTVYGTDRAGIVAEITGVLSTHEANVTDLATHVTEDGVYIMVIELSLPPDANPEAIEEALRRAASGVDISFHPIESDTL